MIQRIQTVYLALAAILSFSLFWRPIHFAKINTGLTNTFEGVFADGTLNIYDNPVAMVLSAITGIISIVAIFLYGNRKIQANLVQFGELAAWAGIAISLSWTFVQNYAPARQHISYGVWFLIAIPVLMYLAVHNIHKDDRLVKSSDRLR
jgi:Domain of unknown function (DUF4293)